MSNNNPQTPFITPRYYLIALATIAKDLFLFHLPQMGSGILDATLHGSYSSGVTYCLPHPFTDKDESNDFIASGCMPITRQTLESWMPSGRADA